MKTRHPAGELGGCPLIANDYPIMTQGATPSKQQLHPAPCLTLHLIGGSGAPVVPNHYLPLYKGAVEGPLQLPCSSCHSQQPPTHKSLSSKLPDLAAPPVTHIQPLPVYRHHHGEDRYRLCTSFPEAIGSGRVTLRAV